MARYNTSLATGQINGTATIGSPYQGAFTEFTGTGGYTVTLPTPSAFPGANQTFYNATSPAGIVTLSTPSGTFTGTGGPGTSTYNVSVGNVVSVTSDGTNYIVISEDGSPLTATTGTFSSNFSVTSGTTSLSPQYFSLTPGNTGTIDNINVGATTRGSGAFNTLTANQAVTFSSNTASSSTTSGTLVVTGGVGVSGTVTAGTVNATNLGGSLSTAAQPNITSVGTLGSLTVSGTGTIGVVSATQLRTAGYAERSIDLGYFPNTTANQAVDIRFGNNYINGNIEVEVTSTYSYQNATGIVRKSISVGANLGTAGVAGGAFWYGPTSRIIEANGPAADNFYISDLEWDSVNATYRITIYHTVSSGNSILVNIKAFGYTAVDNINAITTTAFYTRSAPSPSRHYVNFNDNVGIGNSNPQAKLHVSGGTAGLAPRGGGFTKFMFDNNTANDIYLEIANNSTNSAGVLFSKSTGSYGLVNYNLSNDSLLLYSNSNPRLVINSDGMVHINAGASGAFSNLGSRTAPKFWVQSGPAVMSNQTNGSTYPDYSATALMLGPASTRSATMGLYSGGIGFDGLLNYSGQGNMNYNNDPHAWIGIKYYDTPGYERASFVIATREGTSGTEKTIERMSVDPFGRVSKPYQPAFSMYVSGNLAVGSAGIVPCGGTLVNVGGHFNTSTYRFTAPVAGRYLFSFYDNIQKTAGTGDYYGFRVNGSLRGAYMYESYSGTWALYAGTQVIDLAASDIVDVYQYTTTSHADYGSQAWGNFSGYFLG